MQGNHLVFGKDLRGEQPAQATDPRGGGAGGGAPRGVRGTDSLAHAEVHDCTHMQSGGSTSALNYNQKLSKSSVA